MKKAIASLTRKDIPLIEEISDEVAANISGGLITVDGRPAKVSLDEWRLLYDIASGNIKVTYK